MTKQIEQFVTDAPMQLQQQFAAQVTTLLQQQYPDRIPMAHVHSYGCQQNISDGEKIKGLLATMGYGFTDDPTIADLVIYNTCAVRENAEARIFGNVGELKHCKQRNPNMVVGLCGCMMQQEHVVKKVQKSYPYVDLVFGTHVIHCLPEHLYKVLSTGKRVAATPDSDGVIVEHLPVQRDGTLKAWIPIMYGCNNFCTYCVVPFVRGRERSRNPEEILAEIRDLVAQGYKEFTLLGQNVNSYGKGLSEDISFATLLRQVNDIEGRFRIRFMSSHPKDATKELIDTIADCEKVCKHLHLPVQCGSDRVLSLMNRHYDRAAYLALIDYAKQKIEGICFTSDIIVGFPGETYEDFLQTVSLVKEVEYDSLYTFIYSKRVGTRAAEMEDPIPAAEKSKWFQELLDCQKQIGQARYDSYIGKTVTVLAECEGKLGDEYLTGRTESNIIVEFIADRQFIGQFVKVDITGAKNWALLGEICL